MPTTFQPQREPDGSLSPTTIKAITDELYSLLDAYSEEKFSSKHREHLGVSVIGEKCSRKLWYMFRWVKLVRFPPRMKRLFNRGHLEEDKFYDLLTWMGFYVREIDDEANREYKFSGVSGHYGGTGDNVMLLPWIRDENFRILVEYKTHNKKSFEALKKDGLIKSKPKHHIQMCGYAKAFKIKYGLYCAINKDDDDIHFELLELDWNVATLMEKKAADIISSQIAPPRIAENPAFYDCKYCPMQGICWYDEKVEINCRSCRHSKPVENGNWHCGLWNAIIPDRAAIEKACPQHVSISQ